MSQFAGYVLPGAAFVAFGLKWTLDASTSNLEKLLSGEKTSTLGKRHNRNKKCGCCSSDGLPVEGIIKLLVTAIGILASVVAAYPSGFGQLQHVGDILYATVYLFFAISGLVDVLTFYCPYAIPYGLNHFSLALAFTIEGLMFCLHLQRQAFMEQHVHVLLVCAIFACAVVSLIEIVLPYSLLMKFARAFSSLIHGSWYIQSGFILYDPNRVTPTQWNSSQDYNNALIWISLTFAWHAAGAFICLLVIILISRRKNPTSAVPCQPEHIEAFEDYQSSPALQSSSHMQHCNFCSSHTLSA
ncbi:unnamed protein product [Allacma fusca]|uniref:Transmembrane protein 45B n=1 Tax=Allacma fusca TaxID=39272 RepID=A0A8J2LKW2_9HEXA|nr:unnamed protein product [Allacma fusca]